MAVQVAREIKVGFELAEIGQDVVPAPAIGAEVAPLVIVPRQAAVGRLDVDARAASHHAALLISPRNCLPVPGASARCTEAGPDIAIPEKQRHRIAVQDLGGLRARRQVPARLDQQHASAGVGGKPVGKHASGGAAADNDIVKLRIAHGLGRSR